jgi:hypothetical protein
MDGWMDIRLGRISPGEVSAGQMLHQDARRGALGGVGLGWVVFGPVRERRVSKGMSGVKMVHVGGSSAADTT